MKRVLLFLVTVIIISFACKKEINKQIIVDPVEASRPPCLGDYWQTGEYFFGDKSPNYSLNVPYPLVYNNKVYVFDAGEDEVRIYNGSTWDSIPSSVPFASFARPNFGFIIGNKGYVGAIDINTFTHPFYEYDFATNTWTPKLNFPGERRIATTASCFSVGSKGYVVGGLGEVNSLASTFRDTWAYNPIDNSWTQKADVPLANRTCYATGFSVNNKGYMVSGQYITETTTTNLKQLLEYDTLANTWTTKAVFPGVGRTHPAVFVIGGNVYAGGGRRNFIFYQDFYKYAAGSNTWTAVDDITVTNPTIFGFTLSNKGYVEVDGVNSATNFLMKYTPKSCIYSTTPF